MKKRQRQINTLRSFRQIHKTAGAILFVFFFFISISGILLGWKKHSGGVILPKSRQGISADLKQWLPLDSLHAVACRVLHDSLSAHLSPELERIDVRKEKGMVKFVFARHFWEIQLDGVTGKTLQIAQRRSDVIEKIHDGSIIDHYLGTTRGAFKLFYTSIMGIALLISTVTGFWLWYAPKQLRKKTAKK